jgi:hypothetical protein
MCWPFTTVSEHTSCGVDWFEDRFVHITFEVTPVSRKSPVIGPVEVSLERFAWLDGAFQAPPDFFQGHDRDLATNVTAAHFLSFITPIAAPLQQEANATNCSGG